MKAYSSSSGIKVSIVLATFLITITLYDLSENILALLKEGKPKELWLLDASRSIYAQDFISTTLVVLFVAVSLWFIIDSCLYFIKQLIRRRQLSNPHAQVKQNNSSYGKVTEISWLIFGSLTIMFTSLLLYMPFIRDFPGGDTPFYVGLIHGLENYGILWSLFSCERPLVSLIFYALYLVVPKPNYLTGITLTVASYISLSSLIFSCFSLLLLRRLGAGKFSSLLCVFASYVIWVFHYSGDLYANYLAYALMFAFAYFYVNVLEGNKRDGILCGIILSLIFFTHESTVYVTVAIVILSFLLQFIYDREKWQTTRLPIILCAFITCITLLPFLSFALTNPNYLGVFSRILGPVEERYGDFASPSALLTKKISFNDWNIIASRALLSVFPNIIGHCLVLFGIILTRLSLRNKYFEPVWILLQSWSFLILTGITVGSIPILTGTPHALSSYVWRLGLLMPIPLLLGSLVNLPATCRQPACLRVIIRVPRFPHIQIGRNELRLIKISILMAVAILSLNVSIQYRFYYIGSPKPSEQTIEDALAIRRIFGYGNQSVIIYVQNNDEREVEWIAAVTGMRVFYGRNILELYLGMVDDKLSNDIVYVGVVNSLSKAGLFGNVSGITIVTTNTFASLSPIESEMVSKTINFDDIYMYILINDKDYVQKLYEIQNQLYDVNVLMGEPLDSEDFWGVYYGYGGRWSVIIDRKAEDLAAYKIDLKNGSYFIRLYHIFNVPMNFSHYSYLRFIIACDLKNDQQMKLRLEFASDIYVKGAAAYVGFFDFNIVSGEKNVIVIPLAKLNSVKGFNISSVKQIILRLDVDDVYGTIYLSKLALLP